MTNEEIVRAFVAAINRQDWAALRSLVADEFVRHSYAAGQPGVRSRADLIRFLQDELETFPDAEEQLLDLIADGSKVAARHRFRGTQLGALGPHPPTGKVMDVEYLAIYRIVDGKIVEAWAEWDNHAGLEQLGHL